MKKLYKCLRILLGVLLIEEMATGQEENAALWGETSESSNYGNWLPTHAVDGVLTTWAHTKLETDPWWRVDLLKVYRVNRVTITNRNDYASRINGAVIRVGNFLNVYSNAICGVISTLAASATATFSCSGMEGRYVVVHIPGDQKLLTLAEVGVYGHLAGNRAVGGAVLQSSTSGDWFAEKAIDGNRGFQLLYTGCSSTNNETNPWWRLDLRDVYGVSEVVVTNRNDCCADRINGAEIRIGNSLENNGNNNPICAVIPAIPAGASSNYSCSRMEGRYVNLIIPGDWKVLTFCEVEVYGYLAENLAVNGAAAQSSTSADWFAEKAIDRGLQQLYTGCSSTLSETNPWWRLDLRQIYRVNRVVITNRKDCCAEQINGAVIRIGNSLENNGNSNPICAVIPAIPAGESYSYSCGGMDGRYVNLIIPGDMKLLTLCEVKVYGEGPCLKRSFVKMLFNSSKDLTDSTMRENVLKQLESALADRGFTDVTLRWSQTPKRVIQKVNAAKAGTITGLLRHYITHHPVPGILTSGSGSPGRFPSGGHL
ncbi:Fucolectin-1 [Labeo rohita]|uniref:Fucolectin-1 n=1 Tax=Labeo rohita TaxID=84645 RepID=A0ABQ8MJP6_LABRO|nr:Fucolectin-1 [Labeo rohita]